MKILKIDLYSYFNKERDENQGGELICFLHENSREISINRKYPGMLVIPGGGYGRCSDREAEPIAERYYAEGYNTFILRYSCVPSRYPTQLQEGAMAMAFIRKEADTHYTDADHVAAIGFSAGGHLAGCLATMYNSKHVEDYGFSGELVRPDAAVLCYSVVSPKFKNFTFDNLCNADPQILKEVDVAQNVNENTPPLFIWHTSDDACVNVLNSIELAARAKENNVPFCLHVFEHGQHGLSVCGAEVYPSDKIPSYSETACKWVKLSLSWLKENGFTYID